ncbi:MAG: ABC transporter ATP-binding protein [Ruminococcaceae bacterium]|nr:ABC transporter ATP-binding protein [Oscillospiraceae bacterium]
MENSILEVTDLIKQYKQSDNVVTAVNRVSLKMKDGEFVAIMGTSGSGKSTLLHLCAGLLTPNSGSIRIRGNELTQMSPDQLAKFRGQYVGFIFQKHNLIAQLTALENITVPAMMMKKPDYSYEHSLKKLVETLKIKDRLHHLPEELSGGQQQRVAIARALINRPQILFADEPTGNLDRKNADEVLELLLATQKEFNQTLLMVTHDPKIAARADRILYMENGILSTKAP